MAVATNYESSRWKGAIEPSEYAVYGVDAGDVFKNNHDDGTLDAYDTPSGTPTVTEASALDGTTYGVEVKISDGGNDIVKTNDLSASFSNATVARFAWSYNDNSATMGSDEQFVLADWRTTGVANIWVMEQREFTGSILLRVTVYADGGGSEGASSYATITGADTRIEVVIYRAADSTSADGAAEYLVNGVSIFTWSGIDNYDSFLIGSVFRIGALGGVDAGTSCTPYFDNLHIRNQDYPIGAYRAPVLRTNDADTGLVFQTNHDDGNASYTSGSMVPSYASALDGTKKGAEVTIVNPSTTAVFNKITFTGAYTSATVSRIAFSFDPNSITAVGTAIGPWFRDNATNDTIWQLYFSAGSPYSIALRYSEDGDSSATTGTSIAITDAPHRIEIVTTKASAFDASDATYELIVDGVSEFTVGSLDMFDTFALADEFRLGITGSIDTGTDGTCYFDNLEIRSDNTTIGPYVPRYGTYRWKGVLEPAVLVASKATGTIFTRLGEAGFARHPYGSFAGKGGGGGTLSVNVADALTTGEPETLGLLPVLWASATDAITVAEPSVVGLLVESVVPNYLLPSGEIFQDPADGLTYLLPSGLQLTASAAAAGGGTLSVNVSEAITVGEPESAGLLPVLWASATDAITIGEPETTGLLPALFASATDAITIGEPEATGLLPVLLPSATESITVGEPETTGFVSALFASATDAVTIGEPETAGFLPTLWASATDAITVGDEPTIGFFEPTLSIDVAESLTVGEPETIGLLPVLWADATDAVTVGDIPTVVVLPPTLNIDASESITVGEPEATGLLPVLWASATDTVTIGEPETTGLLPVLWASATDAVTVGEPEVTGLLPVLLVNVSDAVTVGDEPTVETTSPVFGLNVDVFDTVTVGEDAPTFAYSRWNIDVEELVTVGEYRELAGATTTTIVRDSTGALRKNRTIKHAKKHYSRARVRTRHS